MARRKRRGRGEHSIYFDESVGLWIGALVIGYSVRPDGSRKPRRKKVAAKTKAEALQKLGELSQKATAGLLEGSSVTLRSCMDDWLDTVVKPLVDPATYQLHRQRANDYILPRLGDVPLPKLTRFMIRELYDGLEKEGHSPDLRNKVGQLLRRCLRRAIEYRLINDNVAMKLSLPRVEADEMQPLDEAQVKRFLAAAAGHRLYPLWLLALDAGMRQGELLALEWADLDLEAGVVSVTKTLKTGIKGGPRVKDVKTKASRRRIRLTRRTLEVLRTWKARTPGRLVFPTRGRGPTKGKGGYLLKGSLFRSFLKLLHKAGLPRIRFHDLRHTHATLALLKTKNVKAVSARLGHADIRVTLETYTHYLPVMEDELVAAMEDLLAPSEAA